MYWALIYRKGKLNKSPIIMGNYFDYGRFQFSPYEKSEKDDKGADVFSFQSGYELLNEDGKPTYYHAQGCSCLDLVFSNRPSLFKTFFLRDIEGILRDIEGTVVNNFSPKIKPIPKLRIGSKVKAVSNLDTMYEPIYRCSREKYSGFI